MENQVKKHKTGYCPGSFDMFHIGHLNLLRNAKSRCEYLIAGVVTDEVYMSYKLRPPVIPFEERLEIVSQCKYVDRAIGVTMELQDKWKAWEELHYDCHFAGSDHEGDWPELEERLRSVGAFLEFFPYTQSTSSTQIRHTLERDYVFRKYMGEFQETKLVLFGAGDLAEDYLCTYGDSARPAFLVDNNPKKWGTEKLGIKVYSPEALKEDGRELYVIICSRYVQDIGRQLVGMGITDYRIYSGGGKRNKAACFEPKRSTADYQVSDRMKRVWRIELEMLDEIDRICRKHGLKYFLVHGTLLGAVRHGGFIPWDDDLDVAMPRGDFDRFVAVAAAELSAPLSLHTPASEQDLFWGGYARIRNEQTTAIEARELGHQGNLGIWVDVLPLDVCTQDEKQFAKKEKYIRSCHRLLLAKIYGRDYAAYADMGRLRWMCYRLRAGVHSHAALCRRLEKAQRMYTDEESRDVAFFTGYERHRILNAADFADTAMVEFEGRRLPAPKGWKNYLFAELGGDYMKYPPEEERKPKHRGVFDPEKPYTCYTKQLCDIFAGAEGRQIILFGAGMMFEDYMKKCGDKYRPAFLVDNDESKWGRRRRGIEIRKPEAILEVAEGKRHLIICSYYYREIAKQLEQMGVCDYRVYVQEVEWILQTEEKRE